MDEELKQFLNLACSLQSHSNPEVRLLAARSIKQGLRLCWHMGYKSGVEEMMQLQKDFNDA